MTALLEGQGVCKHFGGLRAVDEVDFRLEEGEILGLIGPNGAGKTTLLAMAAGSMPPTSGTVRLDGVRVSGRGPARAVHLGVARTHQIVRPFGRLTVLENVLVGQHFGRPRARAGAPQAREILDLIGLGERAGSLPGELTLGGRKRLELARALATGPRVLLLDEVVAGLNPVEARAFTELIGRIRAGGVSIVMIEHVMQAVMGLSDRVMVLEHGKKIAEGTPAEVAADPRVIEAYLGREDDA